MSQDLGTVLFYKAKMTITSNSEGVDLLETVVQLVRKWIVGKHNRQKNRIVKDSDSDWEQFKYGSVFYDLTRENRFFAESSFLKGDSGAGFQENYWACKIIEKSLSESNLAPREWKTEIGFQTINENSAEISFVVTYKDAPGFIGKLQPTPKDNTPNFIKFLLQNKSLICTIGSCQVKDSPIHLKPGDYPMFRELLFNPGRKIPVIYISPVLDSGIYPVGTRLVSETELAKTVVGNALVCYSDDPEFSTEMSVLEQNNRYTCSGGAVRAYLPNINPADTKDWHRHIFIKPADILGMGQEEILRIFRRAFVQDAHYFHSLFRLESCKALIAETEYKRTLQDMKERCVISEQEFDNALQEYMRESSAREIAEEKLHYSKTQIHNLQVQIAQTQNLVQREVAAALAKSRSVCDFPGNAEAIGQYFERVFSDRLFFTDRGKASLKQCATKPEILWKALHSLAAILWEEYQRNPACAIEEYNNKCAFECARTEGKMTRDDPSLVKEHMDVYKGCPIDIQPHIKNGVKETDPSFIRVYFHYSEDDKLIIIGHVGKHLLNYTGKKGK